MPASKDCNLAEQPLPLAVSRSSLASWKLGGSFRHTDKAVTKFLSRYSNSMGAIIWSEISKISSGHAHCQDRLMR